jgi:hypothetical protein
VTMKSIVERFPHHKTPPAEESAHMTDNESPFAVNPQEKANWIYRIAKKYHRRLPALKTHVDTYTTLNPHILNESLPAFKATPPNMRTLHSARRRNSQSRLHQEALPDPEELKRAAIANILGRRYSKVHANSFLDCCILDVLIVRVVGTT